MLVCLWLLILVDVICPYMLRDKLLSYVLCFHMHSTCQGQLSRSGVVVVLLCLSVFMCCCFNAILLPRTAVENELVWPTSNIPSLMLKHAVRDKSWSPRLTCIIQPDSQYGALSIVFFFFLRVFNFGVHCISGHRAVLLLQVTSLQSELKTTLASWNTLLVLSDIKTHFSVQAVNFKQKEKSLFLCWLAGVVGWNGDVASNATEWESHVDELDDANSSATWLD